MAYALGYWIAKDKKTEKKSIVRVQKQTTTLFKEPNYFHVVDFVGVSGTLMINQFLSTHDLVMHLDLNELTEDTQ